MGYSFLCIENYATVIYHKYLYGNTFIGKYLINMLFYLNERNIDFYNACKKVRDKYKGNYLSVSEITRLAILTPAESFYLLPKECIKIINKAINNEPINLRHESKIELHKEICRRYFQLSKENTELKPYEIAKIISDQNAPRFYISEKTAKEIYYKMVKDKKRKCLL